MFKLMKYEYKKNRMLFFALLLVVVGLEGFFLISYAGNDVEHMGMAAALLVLCTTVSMFLVGYIGINNYDRELNSKSSYLIFMTPNSSLKIILSKLLYTLMVGVIAVAVFGGLAFLDIKLVTIKLDEEFHFIDFATSIASGVGIDLGEVMVVVIVEVLSFVINFFTVVALAYLAITLACTFLQNKRFKGFISIALFIALMIGTSWLDDKFFGPNLEDAVNAMQVFVALLPTLIYNAVVMVASILGCTFLLDRAVSL